MIHTWSDFLDRYTAELPDGFNWTKNEDLLDLLPVGSVGVTKDGEVMLIGHVNIQNGICSCCSVSVLWYTKVDSISEALKLCEISIEVKQEDV